MNWLRKLLHLDGERATKAARVTDLQRQSDAVLARARAVEVMAERDRVASAISHTVRAVRRGQTR